jgi:hypothetical protein
VILFCQSDIVNPQWHLQGILKINIFSQNPLIQGTSLNTLPEAKITIYFKEAGWRLDWPESRQGEEVRSWEHGNNLSGFDTMWRISWPAERPLVLQK